MDMTEPDLTRDILALREARVRRLTAADSWLSLIGKHFLEAGDTTAGSAEDAGIVLPADRAPARLGTFHLDGSAVRFTPEPGVCLRVRTQAGEADLEGPVTLKSDARGEPDKLLFGSLSLEIMERAGAFAVRSRDTESPARTHFPGIDYFPIDPTYRVVAQLERHEPESVIELGYETGASEAMRCPGTLVFEIEGKRYRVDPVYDGPRPRLFVLFRDQTSPAESYGSGRFLYADLPVNDRVVLDFNQAFNPPCAFTPFASCPLPPLQNRLPLAIRAGEKRPRQGDGEA